MAGRGPTVTDARDGVGMRSAASWAAAWWAAAVVCAAGLMFVGVPFRNERITILLGRHAEYAPLLPLLLLGWLAWRSGRAWPTARAWATRLAAWGREGHAGDVAAAVLVGTAAAWSTASMHAQVGTDDLGPLPPAYHDEFSYLFQARTFLGGGVTAAGFPQDPALFDQMHVLSDERMASRYFPGTGAWMLPFVAAGRPWLGHQVAHVIVAVLLTFCGREIGGRAVGGRAVGVVAGLLFAVSPGFTVFSTLLLAHHPTLVGLTTFLLGYLVWMRTGRPPAAAASGCGLAFAMLCRPMTAAAFALPMGVHFIAALGVQWRKARRPEGRTGTPAERSRPVVALAAMAVPLSAGMAAMLAYNAAVTGVALRTPYQVYTDRHTPRHVYGFGNGRRGEAAVAAETFDVSRRMTSYDEWAVDLTPAVAAENAVRRVEASLRLTLGVVPLTFVGVWLLAGWRHRPTGQRLLAWSIVSLHAAHVPYWFVGIAGWHYVMEAGLGWLLLTGVCLQELAARGRDVATAVATATLAVAGVLNATTVLPLWMGEADGLAAEIAFARGRYAEFFRGLDAATEGRPAVVLVRPDPADVATDYVVNEPGLNGDVLMARLRPGQSEVDVASLFPQRDVWLFDVAANRFQRLSRRNGSRK